MNAAGTALVFAIVHVCLGVGGVVSYFVVRTPISDIVLRLSLASIAVGVFDFLVFLVFAWISSPPHERRIL